MAARKGAVTVSTYRARFASFLAEHSERPEGFAGRVNFGSSVSQNLLIPDPPG
jgi:hypothetical protein